MRHRVTEQAEVVVENGGVAQLHIGVNDGEKRQVVIKLPKRNRRVVTESHHTRRPIAGADRVLDGIRHLGVQLRKLEQKVHVPKHDIVQRRIEGRRIAPDKRPARHIKDVRLFKVARRAQQVTRRLEGIRQADHARGRMLYFALCPLQEALLDTRKGQKRTRIEHGRQVKMQTHRLVEARIFVQNTLQLVRRVEQTLVDTLLDIELSIELEDLTQSNGLVD